MAHPSWAVARPPALRIPPGRRVVFHGRDLVDTLLIFGQKALKQRHELFRGRAAGRLQRIFAEWVISVEPAGSLIVLKTPPGSAHLVALALDQAKLGEIAGTIAGDDTLFVAVSNSADLEELTERLRALIRPY